MLDFSTWHGDTKEEEDLNKYFESKCQSRPTIVKGYGYNVVSMVAQCSLDKSSVINVNIPTDASTNVEQLVADSCGFLDKVENTTMLRGLIMDSLGSLKNRPDHVPTLILNIDHDHWNSPRVVPTNIDQKVKQIATGLTDFGLMNVVIVYNNHNQDNNFKNIVV